MGPAGLRQTVKAKQEHRAPVFRSAPGVVERFGDLEAYEHLAGRDVWCRDAQVWQILGQPRGGNTT